MKDERGRYLELPGAGWESVPILGRKKASEEDALSPIAEDQIRVIIEYRGRKKTVHRQMKDPAILKAGAAMFDAVAALESAGEGDRPDESRNIAVITDPVELDLRREGIDFAVGATMEKKWMPTGTRVELKIRPAGSVDIAENDERRDIISGDTIYRIRKGLILGYHSNF